MTSTLQCPHCSKKLAVRTEKTVTKQEFALALLNGETTFDLAKEQMVSPSGRVFAIDGSLYIAGATCALTTTAGLLTSLMLDTHWSIVALSALAGAAVGWVFAIAWQVGVFDYKHRDDYPGEDYVDALDAKLAKTSPTSYRMLPGGIELPELSCQYPMSVIRRVSQYIVDERGSISEGAIAKGENKLCSQNDYKKLVDWALEKHLFKRNGTHRTAGVIVTKKGEWYFSELLNSGIL